MAVLSADYRSRLHADQIIEYVLTMTPKRSHVQARGVERRAKLVGACLCLLGDHHVGRFGLAEVAAKAGIPKTSAYHFFPSIDDVLAACADEVAQRLLDWHDAPPTGVFDSWAPVVQAFVAQGRAFYEQSRAAQELQLGPRTPAEIKNRDRTNDVAVGRALRAAVAVHFQVPDLLGLDGAFFRAIEIADLMFMLSVREHDEITDFYAAEASRAAIAYLELYLPRQLAPA